MDLHKHLMDIVPFRLGSRVRVSEANRYAKEWPGIYVVTGMTWEYQRGPFVNIAIAGDLEIQAGHGSADGWRVEDLELA